MSVLLLCLNNFGVKVEQDNGPRINAVLNNVLHFSPLYLHQNTVFTEYQSLYTYDYLVQFLSIRGPRAACYESILLATCLSLTCIPDWSVDLIEIPHCLSTNCLVTIIFASTDCRHVNRLVILSRGHSNLSSLLFGRLIGLNFSTGSLYE
jgi:hypothetical protein